MLSWPGGGPGKAVFLARDVAELPFGPSDAQTGTRGAPRGPRLGLWESACLFPVTIEASYTAPGGFRTRDHGAISCFCRVSSLRVRIGDTRPRGDFLHAGNHADVVGGEGRELGTAALGAHALPVRNAPPQVPELRPARSGWSPRCSVSPSVPQRQTSACDSLCVPGGPGTM